MKSAMLISVPMSFQEYVKVRHDKDLGASLRLSEQRTLIESLYFQVMNLSAQNQDIIYCDKTIFEEIICIIGLYKYDILELTIVI